MSHCIRPSNRELLLLFPSLRFTIAPSKDPEKNGKKVRRSCFESNTRDIHVEKKAVLLYWKFQPDFWARQDILQSEDVFSRLKTFFFFLVPSGKSGSF